MEIASCIPAVDVNRDPIDGTLLDAATVTLWLREILIQAGFLVSDVAKLTSHSLKATLLSWVAKAGCSRQIRRALGGTRQGLGPHP